jgi:hypothetical protein
MKGFEEMIESEASYILVPFRVGAGQVSEHAAESHPQGEDGLANVGAVLSSCSMRGGKQTTLFIPALRCVRLCD